MWAVLHSRKQAYGKRIKDDLRPYAIFGPRATEAQPMICRVHFFLPSPFWEKVATAG